MWRGASLFVPDVGFAGAFVLLVMVSAWSISGIGAWMSALPVLVPMIVMFDRRADMTAEALGVTLFVGLFHLAVVAAGAAAGVDPVYLVVLSVVTLLPVSCLWALELYRRRHRDRELAGVCPVCLVVRATVVAIVTTNAALFLDLALRSAALSAASDLPSRTAEIVAPLAATVVDAAVSWVVAIVVPWIVWASRVRSSDT